MPVTSEINWSLASRVMPCRWPELAREMSVNLYGAPMTGTDYDQGTVLGQITMSGLFAEYATANMDGTQTARAILEYACHVSPTGEITLPGEWGGTVPAAPVYIAGYFRTEELTGLDSGGIGDLAGRLTEGDTSTGEFHF